MSNRIVIVLEMEGDEADARDVVKHVLDFGDLQDAINAAAEEGSGVRVESATVSNVLEDLRQILWPGGRADATWTPDTAEAVGRRLDFLRPEEPKENGGETREDDKEAPAPSEPVTTVWVVEERDLERVHWGLSSLFLTRESAEAAAERLRTQHVGDTYEPEWRVTRWQVQP